MVAASSEDNLDDGCFSSILKISFSMIGGAEIFKAWQISHPEIEKKNEQFRIEFVFLKLTHKSYCPGLDFVLYGKTD